MKNWNEPSAACVPCYTNPFFKVRLWIRISWASNEQEQFVETEQPHQCWYMELQTLVIVGVFSVSHLCNGLDPL